MQNDSRKAGKSKIKKKSKTNECFVRTSERECDYERKTDVTDVFQILIRTQLSLSISVKSFAIICLLFSLSLSSSDAREQMGRHALSLIKSIHIATLSPDSIDC